MPERTRVVDYAEVTRAAIHLFVDTASLDVQELADRLAIGRATLYRVIDGQDRLLGDVLWVLADRTIRSAERLAEGEGVDRLIDLSRHFHEMVRDFDALRRFTVREPERAYTVLFTPAGRVHERTVERWAALLSDAEADGEVRLPFSSEQFAEMFVRLGESMLWADLLGSTPVDVAGWQRVRRSLFTIGDRSEPAAR